MQAISDIEAEEARREHNGNTFYDRVCGGDHYAIRLFLYDFKPYSGEPRRTEHW